MVFISKIELNTELASKTYIRLSFTEREDFVDRNGYKRYLAQTTKHKKNPIAMIFLFPIDEK